MQMLQRETAAGYDACHPFVLGVCVPLGPGVLSLLNGDCATGRGSFISMNFRLLWAWCCGGMLVDRSPCPFHCLLSGMSPNATSAGICQGVWVFLSPGVLLAPLHGMLDSCNDGGSVPFWIIPIEHYPQLHLDGLHAAS